MAKHQREPGQYTRHVAATIRDLREHAGLSTTEVARRLTSSGRETHQTTVSRLESGTRAITVDDLEALARIFGVAPAALLPRPAGTTCDMYGHTYEDGTCNDCDQPEPTKES